MLKKVLLLFIMVLVFLWYQPVLFSSEDAQVKDSLPVVDGQILEGEYQNTHKSSHGIELFWEFGLNEIYFALKSPCQGWVAIGFEPTNRMNNAKIIIAAFQGDQLLLEEHIGSGPVSHRKIEERYIKTYSGSLTQEFLVLEFILPLGDESRYSLKEGEEYTIILGCHGSSSSFSTRHSMRETLTLKF